MSRNHRKRGDNAAQNRAVAATSAGRNEVRIIGGRWRGRKLRFPEARDLRPTPDRVRETLFNWLAPVIRGARCLDCFAGSGVLGLEALSRGADSVVLIDSDPALVRYLGRLAEEIQAGAAATVIRADATKWLERSTDAFDVVFLDPPYAAGLLPDLLRRLARPGVLAPGAFVYLECAAADGPPPLPPGWRLHRSGRAGDVGYHLAVAPGEPGAMPKQEGEAGPTRTG
jgi:16S rRNA (guanine966-N2)-methyltransferase